MPAVVGDRETRARRAAGSKDGWGCHHHAEVGSYPGAPAAFAGESWGVRFEAVVFMRAVWLRFGAEARARRWSWVALAALIAVCSGPVLAIVAGARRTDTAYSRFAAQARHERLRGGRRVPRLRAARPARCHLATPRCGDDHAAHLRTGVRPHVVGPHGDAVDGRAARTARRPRRQNRGPVEAARRPARQPASGRRGGCQLRVRAAERCARRQHRAAALRAPGGVGQGRAASRQRAVGARGATSPEPEPEHDVERRHGDVSHRGDRSGPRRVPAAGDDPSPALSHARFHETGTPPSSPGNRS